jgi:hypothetical protein
MKGRNFIIRWAGLFLLLLGIFLNIRMYLKDDTWPTYLFYIISAVGLIYLVVSYLSKRMNVIWQVILVSLPLVLLYLLAK